MTRRAPSSPPDLPGYHAESLLGSGGFADVFLYQQELPRRRVAIKVMIRPVNDESVRRQFHAEADVMASFVSHPSIVPIYHAGIAEDSRPFLVMEYCPRRNYGQRFRSERIGVEEVLRVGVQIAGAVETAHRAGILHRDIKPGNILVTAYNRPALTDFGIAATPDRHDADPEESTGLSIPWSAPELFGDPPSADARADVFSLAATVYSLIAGGPPFEKERGRNSAPELINRIENDQLPALRRPDCPESLTRVLQVAMAKNPDARYPSALQFGRALQQIEQELSLPITHMDILEDGPAPCGVDTDDERTRIRAVTTIDPAAAGPERVDRRFAAIAPAVPAPPRGTGETGEHTVRRPARPMADRLMADRLMADRFTVDGLVADRPGRLGPAAGAARRRAWPIVAGIAAVVVAVGVGSVLGVRALVPDEEQEVTTAAGPTAPVVQMPVQPVTDVTVTRVLPQQAQDHGKVQLTWAQPADFAQGDRYRWRWHELPDTYTEQDRAWTSSGQNSLVADVPLGFEDVCVEVRHWTPDGRVSDGAIACEQGQGQ